jgi:hypothetical protein
VKLINLDEFVILGQGSEWLWTMISGLVLAVTFYAIYRQLKLQRDAAAIEHARAIYREWTDERMCRAKLGVLRAIQDGGGGSVSVAESSEVADFWEGIAQLVRAGNIDRKLIYDSLGPSVRIYWGMLAESAALFREHAQDNGVWTDFEWLAGLFARYDRAANERATYDTQYVAGRIPELIEMNEHAVAAFEQLRTVIVRESPDARPARRENRGRGQGRAPAAPTG